MESYEMYCSNGWTWTIRAKSLLSAKQQASRLATHDCGSYGLITPDGDVWGRRQWHGFNIWGWGSWTKADFGKEFSLQWIVS